MPHEIIVDHIISEKHGGPTQADNLAYACVFWVRQECRTHPALEGRFDHFFASAWIRYNLPCVRTNSAPSAIAGVAMHMSSSASAFVWSG